MNSKLKPANCRCGRKAIIEYHYEGDTECHVECTRETNGYCCWYGPTKKNATLAVNAWNKVMVKRK